MLGSAEATGSVIMTFATDRQTASGVTGIKFWSEFFNMALRPV